MLVVAGRSDHYGGAGSAGLYGSPELSYRISFKTAAHCDAALEHAIRALHPCQMPAIDSLAVDTASPPFGDWVLAQIVCEPSGGRA